MGRRFVPAVLTFIALILCYFAYDSLAVPFLHGPPTAEIAVLEPVQVAVEPKTQVFGGLVSDVFPEGSWERDCKIILRNEQIMLFVGEFEQLDKHRLQISPCTIVLRPAGLRAPLGRDNRTWILHAPDKAILQMENEADTRRGSLGRIISAYIPGEVRLTCDESSPGAGDQVELVSSHLQFNTQQIWTPHNVRFRWGPNIGSGTDLTIRFSDLREGDRLNKLTQAVPGGLRSVELVRLERLHIEPPTNEADASQRAYPVELTCDGSIKLDIFGGKAEVRDNVLIERYAPGGRVETVACDEVTARFEMEPSSAAEPGLQPSAGQLRFERLVARGDPVQVDSALIHYSDDGTPTERSVQHQFFTSQIDYDLLTGALQTGRGKFATQLPQQGSEQDQTVHIEWQEKLEFTRDESDDRLVLHGPTKCTFGDNQILADTMRMWFDRRPPVNDAYQLASQPAGSALRIVGQDSARSNTFHPRRVKAEGQVRVETAQLVGTTHNLDVVLQRATPASDAMPDLGFAGDVGMRLQPPRTTMPQVTATSSEPPRRLHVSGELMRLTIEQLDSEYQLRDLTLDGHVRCATIDGENTTSDGRPTIELEGGTLLLRDVGERSGVATIAGNPARIRGRGLDISGPAINLDRAGNRVWIEGAGSATLPLPKRIAERYPRDAAFAYVIWQAGMHFDGRTIRCDRNVNIRGPAQMIRAEALEVELDRSLDFSQTRFEDSDVDLRRIQASGGVTLENRTLTDRGLESIDSAAVDSLSIEYPSGEVTGVGPGWLETVRMGNAMPLGQKPVGQSLMYLRVDFAREMKASLPRRQADFTNNIRAVYGPVQDWRDRVSATSAAALQAGELLMGCDRLSLFQIPNRQPGAPNNTSPAELIAQGNVSVEGKEFSSRAGRISYDGKGLFVMEGTQRAPAQLWRQVRPGAPRQQLSVQSIKYWPATGAIKADGMTSLDFSAGVGGGNVR